MEKKKITISVALAVKNEENNLRACLQSISGLADEIIIVDGGSTDKTVEIAKKFKAKIINTDNPLIFHINKQKALDACNGTWILQLDADEVVTEKLKEEIVSVLGLRSSTKTYDPRTKTNGYYIPRRNYFLGHWMRKGGQYPDYVIRLVKKGFAKFPCKSVHEQIDIQGEVGYLKEPFLHYSYRTTDEYWKKADLYTTLTAEEFRKKEIPRSFANRVYYEIMKPLKVFFNLFIRHKGVFDGWYGLLFAYWSALHYPIAWKKYVKGI